MTRLSIEEGINFLLGHFQGDNSLWPRWCATKDYWPCKERSKPNRSEPEYSIKDIISKFYDAKLQDCRLSPFPDFIDSFAKADARETMVYRGIGIVPDIIMIDIDRGAFTKTLHTHSSDELALNNALYYILDRINEKFHGQFNPTVLWTGNGYHIYLPVQLAGPSSCLGHTDIFMNLSKTPDRDFLRWAEYYLSDGLADPAHYTTTSFKNMWLRVPGSFNSKNGQPVKILQEWDGERPYINWILRDFHNYLVDKNSRPKKPITTFRGFSTEWD